MRRLSGVFAIAVALLAAPALRADGSPAELQRLYFEIGGGQPVRDAVRVDALLGIDIGIDGSDFLSCGLWDLKHAADNLDLYVQMVEDYYSGVIDELGQTLVLNVTNYVQGSIVGVLQRAMPGLYDYSQNVHAQLSGEIEVAKQSCEVMAARTRNNDNPMSEWRDLSNAEAWKDLLGVSYNASGDAEFTGSNTSAIKAEEQAAENQGKESVPWFGGKAGGEGEDPIVLVHDAVSAGYALLSGQPIDIDSNIVDNSTVTTIDPISGTSATQKNHLGTLWPGSDSAVEWANTVIGEQTISFCQGCASKMQSGAGLLAAFHEEREALASTWHSILSTYSANNRPNVAQMQSVSGARVNYHVEVVDAVMEMNEQDRGVFVERLIADAALSLTVEKGMALRRLLRVAAQTPQVSAYEHVVEDLAEMQEDLRAELDELKWELDLQQAVSSNVAGSILSYRDATRQASASISRGTTTRSARPTDVTIQGDAPVQIQDID